MTVYVLLYEISYEPGGLLGVYSTPELAQAAYDNQGEAMVIMPIEIDATAIDHLLRPHKNFGDIIEFTA